MKDYKKLVLEHYGTTIDYESSMPNQTVQWIALSTNDAYNIYQRYTGETYIFWEEDMYYYAENCGDAIEEDIKNGNRMYLDPDIADACGLQEDGFRWQEMFEEYYEPDEELAE